MIELNFGNVTIDTLTAPPPHGMLVRFVAVVGAKGHPQRDTKQRNYPPMPTINKLDTILNSLSDNEVELLIRKYVTKYLVQVKEDTPITFQMQGNRYEEREKRGYWTVGSQYNNKSADGEVLHEVVKEHNRRTGFKSTLLLLEADPIEGEAE